MKHFDEDLSSYLSGDLDADIRKVVEVHLQQCQFCSQELLRLQKLQTLLSGVEGLEPSHGFTKRILDTVRQPQESLTFLKNKRIAWMALAAAAAVVILILMLEQYVIPPLAVRKKAPVAVMPHEQKKSLISKNRGEKEPALTQPEKKSETLPPEKMISEEKTLSPEEVELIANLDTLENMDLILNYEDVDHLETALIVNDEENPQ